MGNLGVIYDKDQIKLLILYVLKNLNRKISPEDINDIFLNSSLVDYFELAQSMNELVKSEHLAIDTEENIIVPTRLGIQTIETLSKSLPLYAREKAMKSALEVFAKISRNSQIVCDTAPCESGFNVILKILEGEEEIFSLKFFVPSEVQARIITKNFKSKPEMIYKKVISLLTLDERED